MSAYPPTAEAVFKQGGLLAAAAPASPAASTAAASSPPGQAVGLASDLSDEPYYPMGSEMSANRPTTPRFVIEEVSSNYEPVMVARDRANSTTKVKNGTFSLDLTLI